MNDPTPYVAAFGPVLGVFLWLWINRQPKQEKPEDPLRAVNAKLEAIRDDLGDVFDKLSDMHTDIAVIKDRGGR